MSISNLLMDMPFESRNLLSVLSVDPKERHLMSTIISGTPCRRIIFCRSGERDPRLLGLSPALGGLSRRRHVGLPG